MRWKGLTFLLNCFIFAGLTHSAWAQPWATYQQTQYKGQEIGKLTGEVYYARMDDYVSVFMLTPEGIILAEPIGTEMATWLTGEMARRVNVPVKHVIYSPYHLHDASRRAVYDDSPRFI